MDIICRRWGVLSKLELCFELFDRLGYAAALSVVLFGIVLLMTLVNWRLNRAAREA